MFSCFQVQEQRGNGNKQESASGDQHETNADYKSMKDSGSKDVNQISHQVATRHQQEQKKQASESDSTYICHSAKLSPTDSLSQQEAHARQAKIEGIKHQLKHSNLSLIPEEYDDMKESQYKPPPLTNPNNTNQNNETSITDQSTVITQSQTIETESQEQQEISHLGEIERSESEIHSVQIESERVHKEVEKSSKKTEEQQEVQAEEESKNDGKQQEMIINKEIGIDSSAFNKRISTVIKGEDIPKLIPNYQEIAAKAIQDFYDLIDQDCVAEQYTQEHTSDEVKNNKIAYLKIYLKRTSLDGFKFFKVRTQYNLYGVGAEEYLGLTMDPGWSKANNPSINEFKQIGSYNDYHVIYISYKRVLIASPRDFLYLKYSERIGEGKYISIQISVKLDGICPLIHGNERGQVILSGCILEEAKDDFGKKYLKLRNYTETNVNLRLAHVLIQSSSVKEMKRYITTLQNKYLEKDG